MSTDLEDRVGDAPFVRSVVREYDLDSGELKTLERWDGRDVRWISMDAGGRWLALARFDDSRIFVRPFWGQTPAVERVVGRHTALGDALLTGEVFLRLVALLRERGIGTLGEALDASRETYYARLRY